MPNSRYFVVVTVLFVSGVVVECVTHCGEQKRPPSCHRQTWSDVLSSSVHLILHMTCSCKQLANSLVCVVSLGLSHSWVRNGWNGHSWGTAEFPPGFSPRALGVLSCAFCATTRSERVILLTRKNV